MIIWWNLTKLFFVKPKNQTHAGTIKKHHQILPKNKTKKYLKEKTTTKNSDLIQARKHVCSQNWTLQWFWIDPHGSSSNPEQRLEIYGLFTDVVVVVVFCASNIHGLSTPRHQILVCGKTRATILPRENFITKYTQNTFLSFQFWAEMSGIRNRILMQTKKIDWKFIMSIKFVKRAKNALFTLKFKLAIQKKTFRSKSTILVFNLRRNAKVTVPISLVTFRQNFEFLN